MPCAGRRCAEHAGVHDLGPGWHGNPAYERARPHRAHKGDRLIMLSSSSLSMEAGSLVRENLYVNGEWIEGEAEPVEVRDPASGELLATVASASAAQVE